MCYRFELLEFEDCLFENVDATYILYLEGNGRIDHIHEQLKTYHPSKKVYIVYNKGYKKCHKELDTQSSGHDILHANITVFEHAKQYKHILILEDDFIFNKDVSKHASHVDDFLKWESSYVYQLGGAPFFAIPIDMSHCRVYSGCAHANIYSFLAREHIMDDYKQEKITGNITGLDNYNYKVLTMYMYHKPLCYQTFPMTDNRKVWFKGGDNGYLEYIFDFCIYLFNTDKNPEPGFSIMYFLGKSVPIILLLFVLWILYKFVPHTIKLKKRK